SPRVMMVRSPILIRRFEECLKKRMGVPITLKNLFHTHRRIRHLGYPPEKIDRVNYQQNQSVPLLKKVRTHHQSEWSRHLAGGYDHRHFFPRQYQRHIESPSTPRRGRRHETWLPLAPHAKYAECAQTPVPSPQEEGQDEGRFCQ